MSTGDQIFTKYWLNMTKYWLNMTKIIEYMSKKSRSVIFSESKNQRKTTRGGGGYSRPLLIGYESYSYPLLMALLMAPDGCLLINYCKIVFWAYCPVGGHGQHKFGAWQTSGVEARFHRHPGIWLLPALLPATETKLGRDCDVPSRGLLWSSDIHSRG